MGRYVKSHSNYVLKTKHQEINDGIIYERDITTIGGRDRFAKGQVPIYKSGNFVITVNNDNTAYKKTPSQEWKGNDEGDVWTLDILKNYEKDEKSSDDRKIVLKKDYYDLRDFAYFGSCSELIRTSVNNIIDKFPGELFIPIIKTWVFSDGAKFYTKEVADAYKAESGLQYSEENETISVTYTNTNGEIPIKSEFKLPPGVDDNATLFAIDNPFGINMHNYMVPEGENPLKYFADGGIDNYVAYTKNSDDEWDFDNPISLSFKGFTQYFYPNRKEISGINVDKECSGTEGELSVTSSIKYEQNYCPGDYMGYLELGIGDCDAKIYVFMGDNNEPKYFFNPDSTTISVASNCSSENDEVTFTASDGESCLINYRIRPKDDIIEDYYKSLNTFESILLNRSTNYNATFEVIKDSDYGYYIETGRFKFPTTYGGYNLGSNGAAFSEYIERLVDIGEYYDERFTDNLWRSMTHEAIKNFDWTYTRHFNPGDEIEFVEGGNKIQKIIRLYGREFDETRSYIDAIADNNTITYDNINNLPDYFFTDKLEDDGWDVKLVNPFKLTEYVNGAEVTIPASQKKQAEITNSYNGNHLERIFTEDYGVTSVKPYTKDNITSLRKVTCNKFVTTKFTESCENDTISLTASFGSELENAIDLRYNADECVCDGNGLTLTSETGEGQKDGYHDDCCNIIKIYSSEKEYTSADVNSEFLKRFILNSKYILRHKGTKEGIEMLLGLFGLRSRDYVYSNDSYFRVEGTGDSQKLVLSDFGKKYYKKLDLNSAMAYDYDIKEYTMFTTRFEDTYDSEKQMYHMDWINSLKLTTYNTPEFRSGRYVSYQGLPVAYRVKDGKRYIYPSFQNYLQYDGGMYYQMNGGWLSKSPFMFDAKNNIIPIDYDSDNFKHTALYTETVKNIKCVQTLDELLSNASLATNSGDICQVIEVKPDMTNRYAIVDGVVYKLLEDEGYSFFYVTVSNNAMSVGNAFLTDIVYISNPFADNGKLKIDLNDDSYNGKSIKVYVVNGDIDVHSNSSSITTFTIFENGKYMEGNNFTNYFRINNPDFNGELSVLGWQQLRDDEYEYYLMDSVMDYDKGNNPHTGHMNYDKGHEYLNRFAHLFKPIYEQGLFDDSEVDENIYEESQTYGFKNLVAEDDCYKNYDQYLYEDDKCHFFGDLLTKDGRKYTYDLDSFNSLDSTSFRKIQLRLGDIKKYHYGKSNCGDDVPGTKDGVTNQIVNTKRIDIEFFLNSSDEYSNGWLEEAKYIDAVILPYLTQMIPSNVILTVKYKSKAYKVCDECNNTISC